MEIALCLLHKENDIKQNACVIQMNNLIKAGEAKIIDEIEYPKKLKIDGDVNSTKHILPLSYTALLFFSYGSGQKYIESSIKNGIPKKRIIVIDNRLFKLFTSSDKNERPVYEMMTKLIERFCEDKNSENFVIQKYRFEELVKQECHSFVIKNCAIFLDAKDTPVKSFVTYLNSDQNITSNVFTKSAFAVYEIVDKNYMSMLNGEFDTMYHLLCQHMDFCEELPLLALMPLQE